MLRKIMSCALLVTGNALWASDSEEAVKMPVAATRKGKMIINTYQIKPLPDGPNPLRLELPKPADKHVQQSIGSLEDLISTARINQSYGLQKIEEMRASLTGIKSDDCREFLKKALDQAETKLKKEDESWLHFGGEAQKQAEALVEIASDGTGGGDTARSLAALEQKLKKRAEPRKKRCCGCLW